MDQWFRSLSKASAVAVLALAGAGCSGGSGSQPSLPNSSSTSIVKKQATFSSSTPWTIPGTIDFDNYDTGGQGVGYNTQTTSNLGGQYRQDGVSIASSANGGGNGFYVGWNDVGDWYRYTVNVQTTATYNVAVTVDSGLSTGSGAGSFHIEDQSGNNLTGEMQVSGTGSWNANWVTVNAAMPLTAGANALKVVVDSGARNFNFDHMTFSAGSSSSSGSQPTQAPSGGSSSSSMLTGANATASSSQSGFPASNVTDGNTNSYWESQDSTGFPQMITLNFGSARSMGSVTLNLPPASVWSTRTETFSVQGSTNGSSYSTLIGSANYTFNPSSGNAVSFNLPAGTSEQYLQLVFTGNTGWPAAQISEFKVFSGSGSNSGSGSQPTQAPTQSPTQTPSTPQPTQAPAGGSSTTNIAVGATITASSSASGFPANNANDGNTSSYWESQNNVGFPQSITLNFGGTRQLGSIVLDLPPLSIWSARTQTIAVLGSTNGSSFSTLIGAANYSFNPNSGNTVSLNLPSGTNEQYLQVVFTGNSGWPAGQLSEFQVFSGSQSSTTSGAPPTNPTSAPTSAPNPPATNPPSSGSAPGNSINAQSYGVVGDGRDNQGSLQNAINAAGSMGKVLWIPAGTYNHSGVLTDNGVAIQGSGAGTVLYATNPDESAIALQGGSPSISKLMTKVVAPNRSNQPQACAIWVNHSSNASVNTVILEGAGANGVRMDGAQGTTVSQSFVLGTNADGIAATNGASNNLVQNNLVYQPADDAYSDDSYIGEPQDTGNRFYNNIAWDVVYGRGFAAAGSANGTFNGNTVNGTTWVGIFAITDPSSNTQVTSGWTIENDVLLNTVDAPIISGSGMTVSNITFTGSMPNLASVLGWDPTPYIVSRFSFDPSYVPGTGPGANN